MFAWFTKIYYNLVWLYIKCTTKKCTSELKKFRNKLKKSDVNDLLKRQKETFLLNLKKFDANVFKVSFPIC